MPRLKRNQNLTYDTIKVENFGPIAKGTIKLRPLTVFTGASNTGKSWLATLIYALQNHPERSPLHYFWKESFFDNGRKKKFKNLKFSESPEAWVESIENKKPLKLTDLERLFFKEFIEQEKRFLEIEILRCFGLSNYKDFIRVPSNKIAKITISQNNNWIFENYSAEISFGNEMKYIVDPPNQLNFKNINEKSISEFKHMLKRIIKSRKADQDDDFNEYNYFASVMLTHDRLIHTQRQSAWYLPADRGGVMHAHRAVVTALIQNASRAGLSRQSSIPVLSGILSDFLENLINLAQESMMRTNKRTSGEHAENLEKNILGGPVNVERTDVNYPRFSWTPTGWKRSLPLLNASSMVSELVPLALYLKYLVSEGDLLILEEPEAHLHPSKQVELINEVAAWVRAGIYVVITTHSEWVLEQLSNLVGASKSNKNNELSADNVGLWQFKSKNGDGSEIQEIYWNKDEGGYNTGFESVAENLHNKWASLVGGSE